MRFAELLKTTVLLSAAAATTLAALDVLVAGSGGDGRTVLATAAWWVIAALVGLALGRRNQVNPAIARLLAAARASSTLPEQRPARVLLNRLWPLLVLTALAGALAVISAAIPGIAAGFAVIWALAWRDQHSAVLAIERRDGVSFFVERTSPLRAISLRRTPGLKQLRPEDANGRVR